MQFNNCVGMIINQMQMKRDLIMKILTIWKLLIMKNRLFRRDRRMCFRPLEGVRMFVLLGNRKRMNLRLINLYLFMKKKKSEKNEK